MFENHFDQTLAEASLVTGSNWTDDTKVRLFARFLGEETDPLLFQRFEDFLEREATEENCEAPLDLS